MNNIKTVYIETYGCQMNFSDSDIISSVLSQSGYSLTDSPEGAAVILLNTCSVRDNAERKIYERLNQLKQYKRSNRRLIVGVLGCMAERLREKLLEDKEIVNIIVGPDEYRKIPELIEFASHGEKGIAINLSTVETYDDIEPLRTDGVSAFISIMRGCNNFCSYCVVPYTRGRERSKPYASIINEVKELEKNGFKEITLLGQNVNSYSDSGFDFSDLLAECAKSSPNIKFRFTTSHPRDMKDKLIDTVAEYDNICKHIHLPVQSGSDRILELMRRAYDSEHYLKLIDRIKSKIPNIALSTDIIAGYPGETLADHEATLNLMRKVRYDGAFMFRYSPRENTRSFLQEDDVPEDEKIRRLNEIIDLQQEISKELNERELGKINCILADGPSKRNSNEWKGRSDSNKTVIFPVEGKNVKSGDLFKIKIIRYTAATLYGIIEDL
jgi:tRNA-2-methylthio-N6-dimethylallyladenosine synthase